MAVRSRGGGGTATALSAIETVSEPRKMTRKGTQAKRMGSSTKRRSIESSAHASRQSVSAQTAHAPSDARLWRGSTSRLSHRAAS
jgi:hypothetical protein